jgi:hypothetical protein
MKLLFTISAILLFTNLMFGQKEIIQDKSLTDSMLFDLNQSVVTSVSGTTYLDVPIYIKSTSVVNSFDFWFKFDETKLTYDTVVSSFPSLDPFTSFNANNHYLSNTTSGPNSNYVVPLNTTLLTIRFILLNPCNNIISSDFNSINTLTNGTNCNNRFISPTQTQQIPAIISTNTFYCSDRSISFSYPSSISGQSITNYSWDFGNSITDNNQNTSVTYTNDGDYTITLVTTNSSGCSFTAYKYIHVDSSPIASFTSSYDSNTGVSTFTNTSTISTGTINQFDWIFGDNLTSQIENPTHIYSAVGTYTVNLTITSMIGCTDSISNTIIITPMTNSLEELNSLSNVTIFPNPASTNVVIKVKEKSTLCLFDLAGNQLSELINLQQNDQHTLNLTLFSSGFYILKEMNENNSNMYKIEIIK